MAPVFPARRFYETRQGWFAIWFIRLRIRHGQAFFARDVFRALGLPALMFGFVDRGPSTVLEGAVLKQLSLFFGFAMAPLREIKVINSTWRG